MKSTILIALSVFLFSCGSEEKDDPGTEPNTNNTTTQGFDPVGNTAYLVDINRDDEGFVTLTAYPGTPYYEVVQRLSSATSSDTFYLNLADTDLMKPTSAVPYDRTVFLPRFEILRASVVETKTSGDTLQLSLSTNPQLHYSGSYTGVLSNKRIPEQYWKMEEPGLREKAFIEGLKNTSADSITQLRLDRLVTENGQFLISQVRYEFWNNTTRHEMDIYKLNKGNWYFHDKHVGAWHLILFDLTGDGMPEMLVKEPKKAPAIYSWWPEREVVVAIGN